MELKFNFIYKYALEFPEVNRFFPTQLRRSISLAFVLLLAVHAWAGTGGTISGTVKDASSAVVEDAAVTALNINTGVPQQLTTNGSGFYSFPNLPIGRYTLTIEKSGFKSYQRTGITIDANSALIVDAVLEIAQEQQSVTVSENTVQVETSSTQMGEVIGSAKMSAVPLNGRSYTDLLALQPGVVPYTSLTASTQQDVGVSALSPSGSLNPGTISINGQREFSNAFIVNGSDVEEDVNSGAAIVPNLDSIAEFRILTSNFDAEYGGHSGGQINVVTKSGTNQWHGDAFEFLRNTALDARNYFSPTRGTYDQNQFGGTLGGPLRSNKAFFFTDYQGTRTTQGIDSGLIQVPTLQERAGIFPNFVIPPSTWSAPAKNLLQYIPLPNDGPSIFTTSSQNQTLRDDKAAFRLDYESPWGRLDAYYFFDDYTYNNPYPVAQSGANVPGFNALYFGRAQLLSLGDTKTLGSTAVNELHFSYMRDSNDLGRPVGGLGVSLASQGFAPGAAGGIVPLNPRGQGVENVIFNAFSIGTNANELRQANNTFQIIDNFSKVVGLHTLKFGMEFHYDQINTNPIAQFNGNFIFTGSTTGSDFADFLLGLPSQYNQSQLEPFYPRSQYWGLFAQDSWRLRSDLTLNYGLRWDRIEPWYEKNNGLSTFAAGKQSVVFPGAPAGILFPGDPGVSRTLAPPGDLDFAPRIGLAYSSQAAKGTFLGDLMGGPGNTSIRAGYGMFYSAIEALSPGILAGNAPFGITYTSPAPPLFATPFVTASNGQFLGQPFPVALARHGATSSNPNSNIDWSQYEPISGIPGYATTNRIPYVEEYMLSIERQLGSRTVFSISYVGAQGHRLLVMEEANPGIPALCLQTPGCGPFAENGSRGPLGNNFGSDTLQKTVGKSNYNSLQLSLRHTSGRLELFAGYTYGKSMDNSSNLGEEINPVNPAVSYALSSFDLRQNFVVSYNYHIPFESLFRASNRWTKGWELSGITRFSTGLPVTLYNNTDNSLLGTSPNGINNNGVDTPIRIPGNLEINTNPRNNPNAFNPLVFVPAAELTAPPYLGQQGNVPRRFFSGPGLENFDMSLQKEIALHSDKTLQLRLEVFNVFNHAQFFGPSAVDGNIGDLLTGPQCPTANPCGTFGQIINAMPPRLVQLAAKFIF
jgi:carboxypeptidase family protein